MIGIYKITNKINNKVYIGQSIRIEARWKEHINNIDDLTIKYTIYEAMRKYGIENFTFEILEECSQDELDKKEIFWIDYYDSYYNGYNMTLGGDGHRYDYDWLVQEYLKNQSIEKTAKKCNCHWQTVRNALVAKGELTRFNNNQERAIKSVDPKTGKVIKEYISISQAARDLKVEASNFIRCLKDPYKHTVKEMFWFDYDEEIDLEKIKKTKKTITVKGKTIYQIDKNTGQILNSFKSMSEIEKELNRTEVSRIYKILKGEGETAYGFKWKLSD